MNNFREVNDDILKDWLEFREENCLCNTTAEDKEHTIQFEDISKKILNSVPKNNKKYVMKQLDLLDKNYKIDFDEICEKILKNVPKNNKKYVMKQLDLLDKNYIDYISYWNEKYYRNGFCDGVQIIINCINT